MLEPEILFEDGNLLVLNKPAGIDVVGIASWLEPKFPGAVLAHRLDKDTSGVLLVAKDEATREYLKNLFQTGQIRKKYLALVYGQPPGGVIDLPIGRSRKDPRRRIAGKGASGKLREAVTEYQLIEKLGEYGLVEARPQTGRTHQIRVHFKAIGYPIVCDALYAPGKTCPVGLARQALHAQSIQFVGPNGRPQAFSVEPPPDLATTIANLRAS